MAATEGLPIAQSHLGFLYAEGLGVERNASRAAEWFRRAADYGEPLGQAALGAAYYTGSGVPRDRVDAYTWTSLAAAQGNQKALDNLAVMKRELSKQEIELARSRAEAFSPKKLRGARSWKPRIEPLPPQKQRAPSNSFSEGRGRSLTPSHPPA
jgi:hypothetical protein